MFPATLGIERNDPSVATRGSDIFASKQIVAPSGDARNDHDMLADVSDVLGFRSAFTEDRCEMDWIRLTYDGFLGKALRLPNFD